MSRISSLVKKVFKNPAILYVISRYATYFIQFINSLFIAVYLGPYYLGIWGFINLVLGYLGQINFGIPHSVNVIVSVNKDKEDYVQKVIGNGLSMILGLSIVIAVFFGIGYSGGFTIGERYEFNNYLIPVTIIAITTNLNTLLSNIFRIYGKIFAIALNQSLFPVLTLMILPFFRGSNLLWAMVIANLLAVIISFVLFIVQTPVKLKLLFNFSLIKYIQKRGWHLFVYNTSFYLILLSTKSFISGNYEVEEFGYFTFAYSLANAILLLLNAISYLIFPKILNRFANATNDHIQEILSGVRVAYISLTHLLIHFVIMMFPLFLLFFPDYQGASNVFKTTALTVVLYTNSFGYSALLMARGKEKLLSKISFSALILNLVLVSIFVYIFKANFSFVIFGTLITYLIYVFTLGYFGRRELSNALSFKHILNDIFPWRMLLPFSISVLLILLSSPEMYFILPFIAFVLLNKNDLKEMKGIGLKVIDNSKILDI